MNVSCADRGRTSVDVESGDRRRSYLFRYLWIVIAVWSIACSWPQHGARAEVYNPIGDRGDHQQPIPDYCLDNYYVIGLRVRVGDWMDQLTEICGKLDSSGNVTAPWHSPYAFGGNGGAAPVDVTCGPNEIMTGVAFLFTPGNKEVRLLSFRCVSTKWPNIQHDLLIGNQTHGGPTNTRQDCKPGEAIWGLKVNWGQYVNAVGIACQQPYTVPPQPTEAKLGPGQTAQGPIGGPGGGLFQTMCNRGDGDEVTGIDTMEKNGVIVRIAPVCGHRQTDPLATYPRAWAGTDTGTLHQPRCEPGAVLTQLHVFVGNLPLVSRVGFTCWNWKTNNQTNSLPDYGGAEVRNLHMVCPLGQIAVGIFGHAGTAIDQLGVVCDKWTAPPPQSSTTLTPDQTAILAVQNNYRQSCGVPKLNWANDLVAAAQNWVNGCNQHQEASKDAAGNTVYFFCHENDPKCPGAPPGGSKFGENLDWGSPTRTGNDAALFWICEWKNYMSHNPPQYVGGSFTSTNADPCPKIDGHFTQVVWRPTTDVGCASNNSCTINGQTGTLWDCKYRPAGNYNVDTTLPGVTAAISQANLTANVPASCPAPPPTPKLH